MGKGVEEGRTGEHGGVPADELGTPKSAQDSAL